MPRCPADDVFASAGRPVHIADISIVDAAGSALPAGETGEITVGSQTQFVGYYRRPELTAEAMLDGRLRTGDIGYLDEAGYLYVTDRAKDMIVSGGMNVYPAEVEAALAGLPGLAELAVFGVPDERWGETVVAVAVVDDPALDEAAHHPGGAGTDRLLQEADPGPVRRRPAPHRQPEDRQAGVAAAVDRHRRDLRGPEGERHTGPEAIALAALAQVMERVKEFGGANAGGRRSTKLMTPSRKSSEHNAARSSDSACSTVCRKVCP